MGDSFEILRTFFSHNFFNKYLYFTTDRTNVNLRFSGKRQQTRGERGGIETCERKTAKQQQYSMKELHNLTLARSSHQQRALINLPTSN